MTKLCDFKRDYPQDFDIVKNIYLVKRQEHVTNGTTWNIIANKSNVIGDVAATQIHLADECVNKEFSVFR